MGKLSTGRRQTLRGIFSRHLLGVVLCGVFSLGIFVPNAGFADENPKEAAERPTVINVWPGKPADDDAATIGPEKFRELIVNGKPYQVAGRPTQWLTNVTQPTLSIYRPAKEKNTGAAMLICPGGGYHNLGWDVEGVEIARWLNSLGVTGIILKYRCPRRPGDAKGVPPLGPLKDAQRAVSLVRSQAKAWDIDPHRIGMIGFSAGGHLVGATATNFEKRSYDPIDRVDEVSCRPDFGIPVYSGYFNVEGGLRRPSARRRARRPCCSSMPRTIRSAMWKTA